MPFVGSEIMFLSSSGKLTEAYESKYANNKPFTPRKILLHNGGNKILTLTPDKSVICRLDTETGKNLGQIAVKLFHSGVEGRLDTVVPLQKFSQLKEQNQVSLAAICGNSITKVNWDVRTPVVRDYVIDKQESFTKTSKGFRFSAITTTQEGHIAAGSKDGTIRLFTAGNVLKRAKTEINQLSDPIIGLDVSANGEWLLGTTEHYLVVFRTTWTDILGEHSAFEVSMPSDKKRVMVLRIPKKASKQYGIEEVSFTTARFDNAPFQGKLNVFEEDIVTSTGPFIVRFKFRHIKIDYSSEDRVQKRAKPIIYKQEEEIVDKIFSYSGNSIVAALCHELKKIDLEEENDENKLPF
jgi:hypothetical protein